MEAAPAVLPEEIRAKLTEAKARFGALTDTGRMELAEKSVQRTAIEEVKYSLDLLTKCRRSVAIWCYTNLRSAQWTAAPPSN